MIEITKSYLAGVIDSDGCIHFRTIVRRKNYARLQISLSSKWKSFANHIHKISGYRGTVRIDRNRGIKKCNMYHWQCACKQARELLIEIYPYLILKHEEARLALSIVTKLTGERLSNSERKRRERIAIKIKKIKRSPSRGKEVDNGKE